MDRQLFVAGLLTHHVLNEMRRGLRELETSAPDIDRDEAIRLFIGLANRDRFILTSNQLDFGASGQDLNSVLVCGAGGVNHLTLQEVADGSLDGLALAISSWVRKKSGLTDRGGETLSVLEYLKRESFVSQCYTYVDGLWKALLWNDYDFSIVASPCGGKQLVFRQEKSREEISATFSHIRKQRIEAQFSALASSEGMSKTVSANCKMVVPIRAGKRKSLSARNVSSSRELEMTNTVWKAKELFLVDQFPDDFLNDQLDAGFSISEVLDVFRCLSLLALQLCNKYPSSDGIEHHRKLLHFCPTFKQEELVASIRSATSLSRSKIHCIIAFLSFDDDRKTDLWCSPLVVLGNKTVAIVTAALVAPVLARLVENWLQNLGVNLDKKGYTYEKTVLASVNSALRRNPIGIKHDPATSITVGRKGTKEEIDLIARIGNTVLIAEIKSTVTADSPISQHRTLETLKRGVSQVIRKASFVERYLEDVFDQLGWDYDCLCPFRIVKCVVNSGRMYIGNSINEVPIVDEKIISTYLEGATTPFFSVPNTVRDGIDHLAWFRLYTNATELEDRLDSYLRDPPHLELQDERYKEESCAVPAFGATGLQIVYSRLVLRDISLKERLFGKHSFAVEHVPDIARVIADIDLVF